MIVDRILDFKMRADEPSAAAQFLCSKLYNEFAFLPEIEDGNMASSMGFAPDVVECAEHLYDHNYDVTFALDFIFRDKIHFRDTLGKKKRWPLAMIVEPLIDHNMLYSGWRPSNSFQTWTDHANSVGMKPFEPQDVSGFSLHSVWTLDRLTKAHEFMQVGGRAAVGQCTSTSESWCQQNFVREDFDTFESISAVLAPYALGPAQPHNYSYSVRICGSNYVEEIGQEGKHVWDLTAYSKYDTQTQTYSRKGSKWFVWNSWKEHIEATTDNVCQFVC